MRSKYERESRAQMAGLSPSFGRITGYSSPTRPAAGLEFFPRRISGKEKSGRLRNRSSGGICFVPGLRRKGAVAGRFVVENYQMKGRRGFMRILGLVLIFIGAGFGLAGCFFGRVSWVGLNDRSVPMWLLCELFAGILLLLGLVVRFSRAAQ